ncbi:MAG: histidine kinase [Allorhizobium sp.]
MKSTLLAAFLAFAMPVAALAAEIQLPSDAPVATVTIPDSWNPTEIDHGVEAVSADEAVYLSIEVADEKSTDKIIEGIFAFLEENGVKVDAATQSETDNKLNGMDVSTIEWDGQDEDGPVSVGVTMLSPKPGKLLLMTYWGTKGEQEKHMNDFVGIIASIKPAN